MVAHFRVFAMIDRLVLRCPFAGDWRDFDLKTLGIPLEGSLTPDGKIESLRHPWESIPSSHSGLAFKVFWFMDAADPTPFVELKASPAKLLQGHNCYGTDDLLSSFFVLLDVFCAAYPDVLGRLDESSWSVAEVDITYASWAESRMAARAFINALQNVSRGQTRARHGYDGTAYFGKKNSRLKKIKVYDKAAEVNRWLESDKSGTRQQYITPDLLRWVDGMVRWEVTLKTRWFERRGISTQIQNLYKTWTPEKFWHEAMADIIGSLEGADMRKINDEEVLDALKSIFFRVSAKTGKISYAQALAAYRTYRAISREGWDIVRETMPRRTFDRHVKMLTDCDISRGALQCQRGEGIAEVIPLVRYVHVDFGAQWPTWEKVA